MLPALKNIREKLYDVMREATTPSVPVNLEQTVNGLKGDKANLIQVVTINQTVNVMLLDIIKELENITPVDIVPADTNPVEFACKWLLDQSYSFNDAQAEMKRAYLKHALELTGKNKDAAEVLGMNRREFSYHKVKHGIKR